MRTLAVPVELLQTLIGYGANECERANSFLYRTSVEANLKQARALLAAPGVEGLTPSDFTAAHLEGRIRTYLQILKGEWPYRVDLTECIEEDLRRLKESRTPAPEER